MKHCVVAAAFVLSLVGIRPVMAQEAPHAHTPKEAAAELSKARFRFSAELEKIKGLVGRWEGTTSRVANGSLTAVVTYEVTGAGSAVIEKLFPGTNAEMTTVYHDDSTGRLVADHYCNAGNQPKLRLMESKGEQLYFVLSPDSDIKADLEGHAHELTLRIGADGSLTHDWLNHYLGAPAAKRNIALTRVK
jgi:hypothetical protein